jgi:short-subunit dehydrogenase
LARLTQLVLPYMRKKKAGKIVNITSMGGKIYTPLGSWYHATRHALEGWPDCLRLELAQFGIDVIIIEPGIIKTEFGSVVAGPMMKRSILPMTAIRARWLRGRR